MGAGRGGGDTAATVFDCRVFSLMHFICNKHVKPLLTNAVTPIQVTQVADELSGFHISYFISHFLLFSAGKRNMFQLISRVPTFATAQQRFMMSLSLLVAG